MSETTSLFSSESVTEGHPDKICDQVSDAVLDAALAQDPGARVACDCFTKAGMILVGGEITTTAVLRIPDIARQTLREIGYTRAEYGIDCETCAVLTNISEQSPDIAQGVDDKSADGKKGAEQGAGDQGMMFGYATGETPEFMPLPIVLAHRLARKLAEVRKAGHLTYLRPDGKSQVTVEYRGGRPRRVHTVVVSTQHDDGISHEVIRKDIIQTVIEPVCKDWMDAGTMLHINPTGKFVKGGPYADSGLTGRKIIVDTYGGHGSHGGGCFSGKDPSKVDRSAAYAARYIAKNLVVAGVAGECEVQLAYAIGVAEPVSVLVDCFGSNKVPRDRMEALVRRHFPLKPADIIAQLNLRRPIYRPTSVYGHFGREEPGFTWERCDKADLLNREAGV